jgi:hypothetical protein
LYNIVWIRCVRLARLRASTASRFICNAGDIVGAEVEDPLPPTGGAGKGIGAGAAWGGGGVWRVAEEEGFVVALFHWLGSITEEEEAEEEEEEVAEEEEEGGGTFFCSCFTLRRNPTGQSSSRNHNISFSLSSSR